MAYTYTPRNPLEETDDDLRRRIDFRVQNPNGLATTPAQPGRNLLESSTDRGPTAPNITVFTDGPQTPAQQAFGDPLSRQRQVFEPGLTREERQRRLGGFRAEDQAAAGRANALEQATIGAGAQVDSARAKARGDVVSAGIQAGASIVGDILGGTFGRRSAGNPLDEVKLERENAKDQAKATEDARKGYLGMLEKDLGSMLAGPLDQTNPLNADAKPKPYFLGDYYRDAYQTKTRPRNPTADAMISELNRDYAAVNDGKVMFDTSVAQPAQPTFPGRAAARSAAQNPAQQPAPSGPVQPAPAGIQTGAQDRNAAARAWAQANPNDPRAAAILQKLGG